MRRQTLRLVSMRAPLWAAGCVLVLAGGLLASRANADDDAAGYEGDPKESAEVFDEAESLREQGKLQEAATRYWDAVDADLRNYRAYVRYLATALAVGDPRDAMVEDLDAFFEDYPELLALQLHKLRLTLDPAARIDALGELAQAHPANVNILLETGRAEWARGNAEAALVPLLKAGGIAPASRPDVLILLAEVEYAAGKTADARKRLETAVAGKPDFFDGLLLLARFDLREGDDAKAAERAGAVGKLRPGHIGALLLESEALSRAGKAEDALGRLTVARREYPTNPTIAIAYADLLAAEATDKSYQSAEVVYKSVLAEDEENVRALYGLGWLYEQQEKFEAAEASYREVMGIDPTDHMAVNSVGYVLFKQGRISEAQVQFKKAIDLNPEYVTAQLNLGATYDALAKYRDGIDIYEQVLSKPGWKQNFRALVNCAFDHESLGAFVKALKYLMRAHEALPKDPDLVTWIGDNYYFQKKWKDAVRWYKKAIELNEKSFFAWRGLGYALARLKRFEDSIKALERANKIDPEDLDVLLAIADICHYELKDLKKALEYYLEYVQRGGDDPLVRDLIPEIQKKLQKKR